MKHGLEEGDQKQARFYRKPDNATETSTLSGNREGEDGDS